MSRMISDRKADMGSGRKGSVFPESASVKEMKSAEGAGKMMDYPDTDADCKKVQEMGISKAKSHKQKWGHRN